MELSDKAKAALIRMHRDFICEIANAGSQHSQYATVTEAQLAMLREAYQRGFSDASMPDLESAVQKVNESNREPLSLDHPDDDGVIRLG